MFGEGSWVSRSKVNCVSWVVKACLSDRMPLKKREVMSTQSNMREILEGSFRDSTHQYGRSNATLNADAF